MEIIKRNFLESSIIASPTMDPNYNYHWTRDSAIVINSVLLEYQYTNDKNLLKYLNRYIDIEKIHSQYHPGEPKFNLDNTPYKLEWGRPQNDGPALRGLVLLKIMKIIPDREEEILKIVHTDLEYVMLNLDKPCYDLWEEVLGFHMYTRLVQSKFLLECMHTLKSQKYLQSIIISYSKIKTLLKHHFDNDVISSYDLEGKVSRVYDSSVLLGLIHIDYDERIIEINDKLHYYFDCLSKQFNYPISKTLEFNLIGRYKNDKYFDGNPWFITTIAYYSYKLVYNKENNNDVIKFKEWVVKKKDLSEQFDKITGENTSVSYLTWNYAEYIRFNILVNNPER